MKELCFLGWRTPGSPVLSVICGGHTQAASLITAEQEGAGVRPPLPSQPSRARHLFPSSCGTSSSSGG